MSTEKTDALVIRLADFSESSRVATLFTRDLGKAAALAKGAKRLKGPFEAALDLLSQCRVVIIVKSTDSLDLLTEAHLQKRFTPYGRDLTSLYGGYYVAELLDGLTEVHDPHPELFQAAVQTLDALGVSSDPRPVILRFELDLLLEIGSLPDFEACCLCQREIPVEGTARLWVSQGGLVCSECGRPEFQHTELTGGALAALRALLDREGVLASRVSISPAQFKDLKRLTTSAISHVLGRRPRMLNYLKF